MQTFLPFPSYSQSASVLDNKRLGKQRVEAMQIHKALLYADYGWQRHPAVKMWRGYERSLADYGVDICLEWIRRGFEDEVCLEYFLDNQIGSIMIPWWFGDVEFHASHRSNLLRKDRGWYGRFGWPEPDDLPYVWPVT
jgi:hypothetical protein